MFQICHWFVNARNTCDTRWRTLGTGHRPPARGAAVRQCGSDDPGGGGHNGRVTTVGVPATQVTVIRMRVPRFLKTITAASAGP